jgi:hypothetical protein
VRMMTADWSSARVADASPEAKGEAACGSP